MDNRTSSIIQVHQPSSFKNHWIRKIGLQIYKCYLIICALKKRLYYEVLSELRILRFFFLSPPTNCKIVIIPNSGLVCSSSPKPRSYYQNCPYQEKQPHLNQSGCNQTFRASLFYLFVCSGTPLDLISARGTEIHSLRDSKHLIMASHNIQPCVS